MTDEGLLIDSPAAADEDWDGPAGAASRDEALYLELDGWAGPLDLLLDLARRQKVDLKAISILALVDQYIDYIQRVEALKLEIAADYLVMAAWLAYLKSRLLIPVAEGDLGPSAEDMATALALRPRRTIHQRNDLWAGRRDSADPSATLGAAEQTPQPFHCIAGTPRRIAEVQDDIRNRHVVESS